MKSWSLLLSHETMKEHANIDLQKKKESYLLFIDFIIIFFPT